MRIVQTVFGVFHHFELARELERRGHLEAVYSTWPWSRLRREGLRRALVRTYPWLHMADMALSRTGLDWPVLHSVSDHLGYAAALTFDRWTLRQLEDGFRRGRRVDALVGISGSSLGAGTWLQRQGGVFVCDRGSSHQRFQERIVAEEYARWGVRRRPTDERDTAREEAIYAQADAITVPSGFALRSFVEMGVPAEKIHVIPYGVRLEAFRPATEPPEAGAFEVLFAGGAGLRKGVPYLLEAFARLRHPRKRLWVAGAVQPDLKDVLGRLPTEGVEFLGPLDRAALVERMQRSHLLALPSIEEGFGLVIPEAMACGCPVLCSENTGGADMIADGREGFVTPVRDVEAMAERMQRLADDADLQATMREAALERVRRVGGWTEYGAAWENLLRQLTSIAG